MSNGHRVRNGVGKSILIMSALIVLAGPGVLRAQDPAAGPVTRVEEDWVLLVDQPNGAIYSPQFHTVMSPFKHMESFYFQVTWNYRELPDFMPGGFQVQSWNGDASLDQQNVNSAELSRSAELIFWTQVLETNGTQFAFSVEDGISATWGAFGHPDTTIVHNGAVTDLNAYSPSTSATNSWITFGQNRVKLLKIIAVRYYGNNGLIRQDTAGYTIYRRPVE